MNKTIHTNTAQLHDLVALFTGILLGSLTGIAAMLLFAPRSGEKTRADLLQKSAQLHDRTQDTFVGLANLAHFDQRKVLAGRRSTIS